MFIWNICGEKGRKAIAGKSRGCSGWAEDVSLVSHWEMSEALLERGRSHNIWYRVLRCIFFFPLKSLLSSPCVLVEVSTDVITLGILNPKVAKKEM